jgi:hypothetical protein
MTRFWNTACGSIRLRVWGQLAAVATLVLLFSPTGRAQGFGPDPFHPYNSDYAQYVWPIAPTYDYGYNGAAVRGIRGANQFQNYMNSLQGLGTASNARGGVGTPYYRANRAYDKEFGRIYQPNEKADQRFDSERKRSNDLYFEYLRERDSKKRADLFREYNRARSESGRALTTSRSNTRASTRSSASDGRSVGSSDREGTRERDLLGAPPPLSTDRPRSRTSDRTRARGEESSPPDLLGPPPLPLGNSAAGSELGRTLNPTEVLERAIRSERERSRVSPRRRGAGPVPPGPPPPP